MTSQISIPSNALRIQENAPVTALCCRTMATLSTLHDQTVPLTERLYAEAHRLNLTIAGPVNWLYTDANNDPNHEFQLTIALPIQQPGRLSDQFTYETIRSFRSASYRFKGPWGCLPEVYDLLFGQFYQQGYTYDGRVREIYSYVDFEHPEKCVTDIQIGIAD